MTFAGDFTAYVTQIAAVQRTATIEAMTVFFIEKTPSFNFSMYNNTLVILLQDFRENLFPFLPNFRLIAHSRFFAVSDYRRFEKGLVFQELLLDRFLGGKIFDKALFISL